MAKNRVLLRSRRVCEKLDISRPTLWRIRKSDPTFPAAVMLNNSAPAWFDDELDRWAESRRVGG